MLSVEILRPQGYAVFMRVLLLGILIAASSGLASAQPSIRQVDFKNFTYPLSGPLLGHGELKWLGNPEDGYSNKNPIHTFISIRFPPESRS